MQFFRAPRGGGSRARRGARQAMRRIILEERGKGSIRVFMSAEGVGCRGRGRRAGRCLVGITIGVMMGWGSSKGR